MPARKDFKKQAYTLAEKKYILENGARITVEEIARETGRTPKRIAAFLRKHMIKPTWGDRGNASLVGYSEKVEIKESLRASPIWKRLKQKFTEEEVVLFEDKYISFMVQFKEDVSATEENQIHKLISYDILMDRNMIRRRKILEDITILEIEIKRILSTVNGKILDLDEDARNLVVSLQQQVSMNQDQERSMSKEFTDLEAHHQKIMQDLKGTRKDRIKQIENSNVSFIGLMKRLQEEEARNHEGLNHALMEKATQQEYVRLATPHKYIDGNEDQPLLSADTIDFLEELHKNANPS